jgi:hypothetical protein
MMTPKIVRTVTLLPNGKFREKITTIHQEMVNKKLREVSREEKEGRFFRLPEKSERPTAKLLDDKTFEVRDLVEESEHMFEESETPKLAEEIEEKAPPVADPEEPQEDEIVDPKADGGVVEEDEEDPEEEEEEEEDEAEVADEDGSGGGGAGEEDDVSSKKVAKKPVKAKAGKAKKSAKAVKKSTKPAKTKKVKAPVVKTPKPKKEKKDKKDKPSSGQSGPPIEDLPYEKLNKKEKKVLDALAEDSKDMALSDLAKAAFPSSNKAEGNSWARNSLRRPVRAGFVEKSARGEYKITAAGKRCIKKAV